MSPFEFDPQTRIVFGPEKIDTLGALASELGAKRALIVSDDGVIACGHTQRGEDSLKAAGLETTQFSDLNENPTTADVSRGVEAARSFGPDLIIGLGGGSSMDCAKGMNFVYTNGGEMKDYWGVGKAAKPMLPMIAVPTTAGTGSETQSFALISDADSHVKMACGDKKAACRIALLDPTLTLTQPRRITALTGIDAISHALETYVTMRRNAMSLAFSREAWRQLSNNFSVVLEEPNNINARSSMQLGAALAGLAIENSMLGAAHALANPLTTEFGVVHGEAIAIMLPHVIRFNGKAHNGWYQELCGLSTALTSSVAGAEAIADLVSELAETAGLSQSLGKHGVSEDDLPRLAKAATNQWTAQFNPRQVSQEELFHLYQAAM